MGTGCGPQMPTSSRLDACTLSPRSEGAGCDARDPWLLVSPRPVEASVPGVSLRETWSRLRSGGASLTRGGRASARGRLWGGHAGGSGPGTPGPRDPRGPRLRWSAALSSPRPPAGPRLASPPQGPQVPRPEGPPGGGAPVAPWEPLCSPRRFLGARPGRVLLPGPLPWGAAGSPAGPARGRRGGRTASAGACAGFSRLSRRRPKVPKPGPGGWAQRSEPRPRSGARSLASGWVPSSGWGAWGSPSPPPLSLSRGRWEMPPAQD